MGDTAQQLEGPDLENGVAFGTLTPNRPFVGHAAGENVVVVRIGDDVHAISASCTHYGGPLGQGLVVGETIRCPWHHACFDLRTGEAVGAPALADAACWTVERKGDLVQVRTKRERSKRAAPAKAPSSVLVVGAGAAGAACVETLRKEGYDGSITMLGDEAPGPVDRPNLSKDYLAGTAPEEWIPLGGAERWGELRVDLVVGDPVVELDVENKSVTTKSGRVVSYDAALYATGAEPRRPAIPGADGAHVHTLRSLADAHAIIGRVTGGAKRAVVVGASFIGLEVAASLVARGLEVHVVAPEDKPLARILGDEVSALVRKVHEDKGTRFHLAERPRSIGDGFVELDGGARIDCDLVVLGVGVEPRVKIAERAGLSVDRGVVVDEQLRTSAQGVWAAGDVARHPDPRVGDKVRIEHWVVAERQGQAAARSMLGKGGPYRDVPFFWSAHHDLVINYVGHAPSFDAVEVHGSLAGRDAAIAYKKDGKTLAVATIGRDLVGLRVEAALARGDDAAVDAALRS